MIRCIIVRRRAIRHRAGPGGPELPAAGMPRLGGGPAAAIYAAQSRDAGGRGLPYIRGPTRRYSAPQPAKLAVVGRGCFPVKNLGGQPVASGAFYRPGSV